MKCVFYHNLIFILEIILIVTILKIIHFQHKKYGKIQKMLNNNFRSTHQDCQIGNEFLANILIHFLKSENSVMLISSKEIVKNTYAVKLECKNKFTNQCRTRSYPLGNNQLYSTGETSCIFPWTKLMCTVRAQSNKTD